MKEISDEKWESTMAFIRESIRNPDISPDDVLLLSLSREELTRLFTKRRIELVDAMKSGGSRTMSELARLLGRELSAIERDLKVLEGLGLARLEKKGREVTCTIEKEILILPLTRPMTIDQLKVPPGS